LRKTAMCNREWGFSAPKDAIRPPRLRLRPCRYGLDPL